MSVEQLEMCTTLFFYTSQFKTRQLTWIDMYELNHGLRKSNTDIHCIFLVHSIYGYGMVALQFISCFILEGKKIIYFGKRKIYLKLFLGRLGHLGHFDSKM